MKACALTSWVGTVAIVSIGLYACGGATGDGAPPVAPEPTPATPGASGSPALSEDAPLGGTPATTAGAVGDATLAETAPGGDPDSRTMESIANVVKGHRKEARECYEKGLKQIPGLKGDVVIHFVLKPSGQVKQAELNEQRSTIREASVVSCVIDVIHGLEFPKSSKGMESQVNYPFNFNP